MLIKEHTNRLIHEKSPYLLQHAHNPVDWYPWGEEAFAKAKREDKPVFLSVGYSTCHWCHVMERESFEDEEVARQLNRDFVCIKVDKEERPDIDAVYMAVCQALTGQGGWPMTVIMTPDRKPFFAGTYFPKTSRYGMMGLTDLLSRIVGMWHTERGKLTAAGEDIEQFLKHQEPSTAGEVTEELINEAISTFRRSFDAANGGFGVSPKFPTPHNLLFLLRAAQAQKDEALMHMAEKTLQQMARGGIYDHIGGGFSRYSTDSRWLVPHFEKMLYDNALLAVVYLEGYQATKKLFYRDIARRTLEYVLRDMTDPQGGFYSAQDADSEGEEGKYYAFAPSEIRNVLGEEDGSLFCERLDITRAGNFEGKNVPNRLSDDRFTEPLPTKWLEALDRYRRGRTELYTDDKVLTAWNGLMIAALAKAYGALGDERYLTAARRSADFILKTMKKGSSLRVWYRDGESGGEGHLDDYAFMIWALIELYETTYEPSFLDEALWLNEQLLREFWDENDGGFYLYGSKSEQLLLRPKDVYDGAIPSGNSVAALNLLRLARLTSNEQLDGYAQRQLTFLAAKIREIPSGSSFALLPVMLALYGDQTLVCVLPDGDRLSEIERMLHASLYLRLCAVVKTPQNEAELGTIAPFTREYKVLREQPTFYFCSNHACSPPVCGMEELGKLLASL